VRFSWPEFNLDSHADTRPDLEGLQVNLTVHSDLPPGVQTTLYLREGDDKDSQRELAKVFAQDDGTLLFSDITIIEGEIVLLLDASDDCGKHRSGKRLYVWDGQGIPQCTLDLATPSSDGVLGPQQDEDDTTSGMQVRVLVQAGRPDMEVRLFVRNRTLQTERSFTHPSQENGDAEFALTLEEGEQAIRAVCLWEPRALYPSSATHVFQVLP